MPLSVIRETLEISDAIAVRELPPLSELRG